MALGFGSTIGDLLGGAGSIEMQIGVSVGVGLLAIFAILVLVPRAVELIGRGLLWLLNLLRMESGSGPIHLTDIPGVERGAVRIGQASVAILATVALLGIWGEIGSAKEFVRGLSIPMSMILKGLLTVLLLVGAYSGMGVLHSWLGELTKRSEKISPHQEEIWLRVLQIIFLIAASIVALSLWGVDLGGLLVGAGFLGIVAGLAAQQTLGALIAGFVLMLSRPFEIGDWVQIGEHEGIVSEITIVNTRLQNFDGELIALPNDLVGNSTIVNRTTKGRLRLRVEVGIDYDADPDHASDVAEEALGDVDRVLTVPRPRVVTSRFADSAIVLELRFWIDKPSARRRALAISDSITAVAAAFEEEDIKIPFPQRELSGRTETDGFRVIDEGSTEE
ncbi:MAG: mechanosensitive ion channel family protein [Halodesulfurarchaeum sp.]